MDLSKKVKVLSFSKEYETDIITLFHATGDFNYRSRWQEGVKAVEEISHFLPRIGTRCKCELENGETSIYSTSYFYSPGRIEFSEMDEKQKRTAYYTLEKKGDTKTKLTLDFYLDKNIVGKILFGLGERKKIKETFEKSLLNLAELVKTIKLPKQDLSLA